MSSPYMSGGQPSNYAPPQKKGNSAVTIVVVLLVVLIAIGACAAVLLPKMLRTRTTDTDTPVASQPAATTPAASNQPAVTPAASPAPPSDSNNFGTTSGNVSSAQPSATTSHRARKVGRGSVSDYGSSRSSQTAAQQAEDEARRQEEQRELDQLAHQANLLDARLAADEATINTMKQAQAEQGLGMRGDIVAAQERLHGNMSRLDAAIQNRDLAAARQYLKLCDRDAATLDEFVGH